MIECLDRVLESHCQPGLAELRGLLQELLGGPEAQGRLIDEQTLQPRALRVFRLRFEINGQTRQVIVKRLKPEIGRRSELVERRWLPAAGMAENGPALLGSIAEPSGNCVWHVYDDLGPAELDVTRIDRERVRAAIKLVARLHMQFARHRLLGEVRLHGCDLGMHFYAANVRDATYALEACQPSPQQAPLRDGLLERLSRLSKELPQRTQALETWSGPETLLHGDLWHINIFVIPTQNGLHVRLIDWDHASVGPASYDLSTFLLRLPSQERSWVLDVYRDETSQAGWCLPTPQVLNFLFETAEYARMANRIIWPAIALVQDGAAWAWESLEEINQWFEDFAPVLPCENEMQGVAL
jgi:aminoglycoside/choline kinase family phosphotransferase